MAETSEVVIIGGGVAGCSVAYHLALAGVRSTIIEREGVGSQASGYAAGGLNPLEGANIPGSLGPLALESYRMHLSLWDRLKEETGIDCQGRINVLVKLAFDDSEVPELRESLDRFNSASADGFSARWLDPPQLRKLEPRLAPEAIGGVSARGNAALDSYQYTRALAAAAEQRGARVQPGNVRGFNIDRGRVTGVLLEHREIACGQVVLATGPWSREVEPWLDISLPVDPLKGEILRLELPGPPLTCDFSGGGGSLYPKPDGLVWCGATEEWQGFDRQPSETAHRSLREGATRILPELARSPLVQHTACLRPVTPDWLPIVGWAPGWDNVLLTTGAGKKGILLSTGMGRASADLLTRGTTEVSIGPCSPGRPSLAAGYLESRRQDSNL